MKPRYMICGLLIWSTIHAECEIEERDDVQQQEAIIGTMDDNTSNNEAVDAFPMTHPAYDVNQRDDVQQQEAIIGTMDDNTSNNEAVDAFPMTHPACSNRAVFEARVNYFRPFSKTFREVFHGGGIDYALESTIPVWNKLNIWAEIDYFSREGKMVGIHRSAQITIIPITLGLKYIYAFNRCYGIYGGVGAKYYFIELVNRMSPIYRTIHRQGVGGVVEIGNLICLPHNFVIDIFTSWSFIKSFSGLDHLPPNAISSRIQVGGWNIGGGIGYKF